MYIKPKNERHNLSTCKPISNERKVCRTIQLFFADEQIASGDLFSSVKNKRARSNLIQRITSRMIPWAQDAEQSSCKKGDYPSFENDGMQ